MKEVFILFSIMVFFVSCKKENGSPTRSLPTVITGKINSITNNSAICEGSVLDSGSSSLRWVGVCYSTSSNPDFYSSNTSLFNDFDTVSGNFVATINDLSENTTYYIRAFAINMVGVAYGAEVKFKTAFNKDSTFIDARDGKVYTFKNIGSQVWMTKNLDYETDGSFCADCETYGRLYYWNTALIAAPAGWHLPSDSEWTVLTTHLGGEDIAGNLMKSTSGWHAPNNAATNTSGFSALPAGLLYFPPISVIREQREFAHWWSSTEIIRDNGVVWVRSLNNKDARVIRKTYFFDYGLSVRCIRD